MHQNTKFILQFVYGAIPDPHIGGGYAAQILSRTTKHLASLLSGLSVTFRQKDNRQEGIVKIFPST